MPTRDVIWAQLADAYRSSALKQTDPAEKSKRLQEAFSDYQKAIDLKQKAIDAANKKDPEDNKRMAAYYNNLGDVAGRMGKIGDATKAYSQAAQINPDGAAGYYYNAGAVLTNAGKGDDAIAAFDKSIAADPNKADAYYQKGVNLIGKATLKGDKMVAPPGTAEAFNKYLELAPTGPYADVAKQMLASIGAPDRNQHRHKKESWGQEITFETLPVRRFVSGLAFRRAGCERLGCAFRRWQGLKPISFSISIGMAEAMP